MDVTPRRERKVVTVLFADLVGFTARAESLDPEDVEAILRPYHERLREELEQRGGTVEKFVGDAVMAVFGAPLAHEDDPERAVRAALAIRDGIVEDGTLEVRTAVNTGEALVSVDARPERGEGMVAGDVVNTASRLQSAAPANGILVGEATYRATRHVIDYSEHAPVDAKGKAEPVPVWEVVDAKARIGVEMTGPATPLVGRERERDLLLSTFDRVRRESSTQLVTIAGVPGIGKSRLVAELYGELEREAELTNWRRGRALPYGEGGALWAFAEMIKAQAGILESDGASDAERKLREAVEAVVPEDDVAWVEGRLRPLVGLTADSSEREESFAAWRRFVEGLVEQRPTVLVFEDLHWADEELLDFVDELVDWVEHVPLLVVATARPELFERRPDWGGGKRNALTVSLAPLDDGDTARLLAALLDRSVLPAEQQQELLARAGGNPLYAEQFARMFAERGESGAALPETVQGIITARLDSLPPEEKELLLDAAVLGKTFWRGALGGDDVESRLRSLQRKEFIRRERHSAVARESEFSFAHLLIRDVAYAQIPRAERAEKHVRAARWIDSLSGDRGDDLAELRAHHYASALELVEASGGDSSELVGPAVGALIAAAQRAEKLFAFAQVERYASRALALASEDDARRPMALLALAAAEAELGNAEFHQHATEAALAFRALDDRASAAEAETLSASWLWNFGRRDEARAAAERALALVGDEGVSKEQAAALAVHSRLLMLGSQYQESIDVGIVGLDAARQLGEEGLEANLLITMGTARNRLSQDGMPDLEQGGAMADRLNLPREYTRAHNNVAEQLIVDGDFSGADRRYELALERMERLGIIQSVVWLLPQLADLAYIVGDWAQAERQLDRFDGILETISEHYLETQVRGIRAAMAVARGHAGAGAMWEATLESARSVKDPQALGPALTGRARFLLEEGQVDAALALVDELLALQELYHIALLDLGWLSLDLGRELKARPDEISGVWGEAGLLVAEGKLIEAAEFLAAKSMLTHEAYARLRAAEQLASEGRGVEAQPHLERALAFYRSVGASRYVRRGEALLPASA
jgi:class 3 adenylate cyclase/tetratricopeptide (TPR) repeat protein